MRLNQAARMITDDLSGDWRKDSESVVSSVSDFQEQAIKAINGKLTIRENTTSWEDDYDLDHGVETRIKNPLDGPCRGVFAVKCVGVELDSGNKPTRKLYSLSVPRIDWEQADSDGKNLLITATFPRTVSGAVDEVLGPITRLRSNAAALTSPNTLNVCTTTSITLTPGAWLVRGAVGFNPAATTNVTLFRWGVSATSATLPATDTLAVPTSGEIRFAQNYSAGFVPGGDFAFAIPAYRVSVATGATLPLFLVASSTFTVSTSAAYGWMEAARVVETYSIPSPRGRVRLFFYGG